MKKVYNAVKDKISGKDKYKNTMWNPDIKEDEWVVVDKNIPRARLATLTPQGGQNPRPDGTDTYPEGMEPMKQSNDLAYADVGKDKRATIEIAQIPGIQFKQPNEN